MTDSVNETEIEPIEILETNETSAENVSIIEEPVEIPILKEIIYRGPISAQNFTLQLFYSSYWLPESNSTFTGPLKTRKMSPEIKIQTTDDTI